MEQINLLECPILISSPTSNVLWFCLLQYGAALSSRMGNEQEIVEDQLQGD